MDIVCNREKKNENMIEGSVNVILRYMI